jgi:hypothetical protein
MTERAKFRYLNCGEKFEEDVLTADERRQYERERRRGSPVHCPACNRTDLRRAWS